MKLNSPWKALLWEEMCVAVAVVATILLTVFIICSFYLLHYLFFYGDYPLRFLSFDAYYAICLIFSVLTSFLLLLYNTNLGQLKSGFSRRILQLPVPTYLPVLISLGTRFFLLLAQTVIVRFVFFTFVIRKPLEFSSIFEFFSVYWKAINDIYLANGHTFSSVILMDGFIYLTFQTVSWLLDLSTSFAWVVFIYTSMLVAFVYTIDATFYNLILTRTIYSFISNHQIITLALLFIICYFINLQIVKGIRHNLLSNYNLNRFPFVFKPRYKTNKKSPLLFERFPNRYIAQLWFEIKQNRGFVLPKWTFLLWILGVVILIASDMYLFGYFPQVNSFHVWVTFPQLALLVSGIVWYLRIARPVYKETSHKTGLSSLLPTTNIERINSYTLYFSINLLLAMTLIWIIQFTGLYIGYRIHLFNNYDTIRSVLTVNAADFDRFYPNYIWDIVFFVTGWVVFTGALVWLLVSYPGYVIFLIALVPIIITDFSNFNFLPPIIDITSIMKKILWILDFVFSCIISSLPGWRESTPIYIAHRGAQTSFYLILLIIYLAICCYFVFMSIVYMFLAIYNRIIKPKAILPLLAILLFVFICLFPYWYVQDLQPPVLYPTLLFLTFLISMYWLRLVVKSYGLSLRKSIRLYCSGISSSYEIPIYQIFLSHIFIIIIALLVLGIRFHSVCNHERISAYLKEKNLPTILYEFKNMGKNVPDEENLALKYLELQKIYKLCQTSIEPQTPQCRRCPEEKIQLSEEELKLIDEIRTAYEKCIFYIKGLNIPKKCFALPESYNFLENLQYDEPFPEIFYKSTKIYFDTYGKYFAQSLKDISKLNLTKSYYGENILEERNLFSAYFGYFDDPLKNIKILSQILTVEAFMYAIDENYPEMLESFRANLTLYNSLKNEYDTSSWTHGNSCFDKVRYVIGWILNHKILPEEVRVELQNIVEQYIPKTSEDSPMHKELLKDTITIVDKYSTPRGFVEEYFIKYDGYTSSRTLSQLVHLFWHGWVFDVWCPFTDLLVPRSMAQTKQILNYFVLSEYFNRISKDERIDTLELVKYYNYLYNILKWYIGRNISCPYDSGCCGNRDEGFIKWLFYVSNSTTIDTLYGINNDLECLAYYELWKYSFIKMFKTSFAIEQFLATQQRLPEDLQELVPNYIPSIPFDPYSPNKTINYRIREDGGYIVYSVGVDRIDNNGVQPKKFGDRFYEYYIYYRYEAGDYVLPISSLEKRQQPDVSNEVIPECIRKEMEE